jgi:hypothetical protein
MLFSRSSPFRKKISALEHQEITIWYIWAYLDINKVMHYRIKWQRHAICTSIFSSIKKTPATNSCRRSKLYSIYSGDPFSRLAIVMHQNVIFDFSHFLAPTWSLWSVWQSYALNMDFLFNAGLHACFYPGIQGSVAIPKMLVLVEWPMQDG